MNDERHEQKCFYASPEYSASFWGKNIWLYQGKGTLRLTAHSLRLDTGPGSLEIPFHQIKSIGLGRFSVWAKPGGLDYLTVRYEQDGELKGINLVPYVSVWDPTWNTCKHVAHWYEKLRGVEELTGRLEPPQFDPAVPYSKERRLSVTALLFVGSLMAGAVFAWLLYVARAGVAGHL